ncbi:MAG: hypothetical protein ACOH5I_22450 [Oligoflexus sp.]
MDSLKANLDAAKDHHKSMIAIHTMTLHFLERANKLLEEVIADRNKVACSLESLRAEVERLKAELEKQ